MCACASVFEYIWGKTLPKAREGGDFNVLFRHASLMRVCESMCVRLVFEYMWESRKDKCVYIHVCIYIRMRAQRCILAHLWNLTSESKNHELFESSTENYELSI